MPRKSKSLFSIICKSAKKLNKTAKNFPTYYKGIVSVEVTKSGNRKKRPKKSDSFWGI